MVILTYVFFSLANITIYSIITVAHFPLLIFITAPAYLITIITSSHLFPVRLHSFLMTQIPSPNLILL